MLESEVEKKLCKRVKDELHGRAFKFVSPGFNGVPDRIVLVPTGRIYFVETKAPGKNLRKLQKWVRELIQNLGFIVLRVDTIEKVDDFIIGVLNEMKNETPIASQTTTDIQSEACDIRQVQENGV